MVGVRRIWGVAVALTMTVALAACGSSSGSKSSGGEKKSDTGGVSTGQVEKGTPVAVELGDTKGTDGPMTMTVSPDSVPAGKVTFTAKNTGTVKHEMVVLKTDTPGDQLVVTKGRVSEKDSVGEIGEFGAGKTASVTLDLAAGKYVLVCNIKDHYSMGMWSAFTVT